MEIEKLEKEIELDYKAFLLKLKSLWYVIVIGTLLGGVVAGIYAKRNITPLYQSSTQIYLKGSNGFSLSELQIGTILSPDYEVIFRTRANMQKVIDRLGLDMSPAQLRNMVYVFRLTDTHILQINVTSDDPELSMNIANTVAQIGMDVVREIDSQEPYILEEAIMNPNSISKSIKSYISKGLFAGFIATIGFLFFKFLLSDTIGSIEDVENGIGLPVLAVVREDKILRYHKKVAKK